MTHCTDRKQSYIGYCNEATSISAFINEFQSTLWKQYRIRLYAARSDDSMRLDASNSSILETFDKALHAMGWVAHPKLTIRKSVIEAPVYSKDGAWFLSVCSLGVVTFLGEHLITCEQMAEFLTSKLGLSLISLSKFHELRLSYQLDPNRTDVEVANALYEKLGGKLYYSHHYHHIRAGDFDYDLHTVDGTLVCNVRPTNYPRT